MQHSIHHHHSNHGFGGYGQGVSGQALLRRVVPNLHALRLRYVMITIILVFMSIGFVVLAVLGFTAFARPFGFSGNMTQPNFGMVVPGMFGALIMLAIAGGYGGTRIYKMNRLFEVINEIQGRDKVTIENLSLSRLVGVASTTAIVARLISTGNLSGYEVIGEVGIGKVGMGFTEVDFGRQVNVKVDKQPSQQHRTHCSACGAAIKQGGGKFCQFCGAKL
ncbi:MAG: zinc ribbon domain-containing protein [Firmicutes bacterium]|nr:zinc ribbon domain-containing protein [Bacillota bacterium]